MAKYLRYYMDGISTEGHTVRAEILQEADAAFTPVELDAGTGSPLTISWKETGKIEPVQASTATLIVNAATDGQLLDFASMVRAGQVRLDVYRDGSLWWSGTLDSEGYGEPYTDATNYDVQLDFQDFGALNRIKWTRTGRESMATILQACLDASGISYGQLLQHISTRIPTILGGSGVDIDFSQLVLNNDNFYDEEGEAMSCMEVLKGILQPFALRVIQRCGNIYLYDLHAASALSATDVTWRGADSAISFDVVYNDAKVSFSPYGDDTVLDGEVEVTDKDGVGVTVKTSYNTNADEVLDGFVIRDGTDVTAEGPTLEHGAVFFDIESEYSGSDESGILWGYKRGNAALSGDTCVQMHNPAASCFRNVTDTNTFVGQKIATFPLQFINGEIPLYGRPRHKLRINLDLLLDVRYNPFEEAGDYNEKRNFKTMTDKCGFVWVPVMVTLRDAPGGTALYHLENYRLALGTQKYSAGYGTHWVQGEGTPGCFFLAYYDHEDRKSKTGIGGWATNRRCIGYYTDVLPSIWSTMAAGEYVSVPMSSGYLEMSLYSGFHIRNRNIVDSVYNLFRWVAYKDAKITLVKQNGLAVDMEDQEDVAYINADAQEKFSVDTIVGTLSSYVPRVTGRGLMSYQSSPCETFQRAGVTDRLEKLLLGTIYSQYAERKMKLSGTVGLLSAFVLGDSPRVDGKFLLAAETQNVLDDIGKVTMTEFGPDEYEGIDYE